VTATISFFPQPPLGQTAKRARLRSGRRQVDLAEDKLNLADRGLVVPAPPFKGDRVELLTRLIAIEAIESLMGIVALEGGIEIGGVFYPLSAPGNPPFYPPPGSDDDDTDDDAA
jgi:hypothetical protein